MNKYAKGIFITKVGTEIIKQRLNEIIEDSKKYAPNNSMRRNLYKSICHQLIQLFDDYFENNIWSVSNCREMLCNMYFSDNIEQLQFKEAYVKGILVELKIMLNNMIPLNHLPSCSDMFEIKEKDIVLKSIKNISQNEITLKFTSAINLVDKAGDVSKINEIASFYIPIYNELNRLIYEEHWTLSSIEQHLLLRVKAELGYCYLAAVKTGIEVKQEVKDLIKNEDQAKNYINKYSQSDYNFNSYLLSPQI